MTPVTETDKMKYMRLLSEKYPTARAVSREIINMTAILNLPKGTEHFMSDIHGEYEAFCHILNNCSGVIREKVKLLYADTLSADEIKELCTLIYYPDEKLRLIRRERDIDREWYLTTIRRLIEVARILSSKYTRSKVRKAMPEDYGYIIDELLHAQKDEDNNQVRYHDIILDTIIRINADDFLISLSGLIKRLAVDRLHIVGDIFDRGDSPDKIISMLMQHHSLDIEWGNHDILWMGAACGSKACIAGAVRNCLNYNTVRTLESGYGISLRGLTDFARNTYPELPPAEAELLAIKIIRQKLEGQVILRNPEYGMDDRLLLDKIDYDTATVTIDGKSYPLNNSLFPTVDRAHPYELSDEEKAVMDELKAAFLNSKPLQKQIEFLYEHGGMYRVYNDNLLYHGCVPMNADGSLKAVRFFGEDFSGKAYFDMADTIARHAYFGRSRDIKGLDFMWYLHCGDDSPLCGRKIKDFAHDFIDDPATHAEEKNPYYSLYYDRKVCEMILREFGLRSEQSHIINGHTPVRTVKGELPIRADGKLLVIDGGFCRNYHEKTGIAGYTLIYNSHGLRLKAHHPFNGIDDALHENLDIRSDSEIIETEQRRMMVEHTDNGERLQDQISDLYRLLELYRGGVLQQNDE